MTLKRALAWLAIVAIIGLFLYFSLQTYRVLKMDGQAVESAAAETTSVVARPHEDAENRTNWAEVVAMLVIGTILIYAIRKTDQQIGRDKVSSVDQKGDRVSPNDR